MGTDGSITIVRQNSKIICRNFKNFNKAFSVHFCFVSEALFSLYTYTYIEGTYAK